MPESNITHTFGTFRHRVEGVGDDGRAGSMGEFAQGVEKGLLGTVEHAQAELDLVGEARVKRLGAAVGRKAGGTLVERVFDMHANIDAARHAHELGRFHSQMGSARVGAHEAARAQKRAAEIARHHAAHILQAAAAQHVKHGRARSTLRLTVVASALPARTQHPCVHVVPGQGVRLANLGDEGKRLLLVFNMVERGDETACLLFKLGCHTAGNGGVGTHGR